MKSWYATNARDLLLAREQGLIPSRPVVVSLVGGEFEQPAMYAHKDMPWDRMDWRMLVNLDVWLWAGPAAALDWVLNTTERVARARPKSLFLRFEQGGVHDVEVGEGLHIPEVQGLPPQHSFTWTPINCSGTEWSARLRKALIAVHPCWTEL